MATTESDYYELLGVPRSASDAEIKSAFRALARELHPDVSAAPDAERRFRDVAEAFEVLSDPERRATYDRFGKAGLARGGFEPFAVHDSDLPAKIGDQAGVLERRGDDADGRPRRPEHHRGEFLGQRKVVRFHPIVCHQQPARQPLLDGVHGIASRRLHDEADQRLGVIGQDVVERASPIEFAPKCVHRHPVAHLRRALDDGGRRRR